MGAVLLVDGLSGMHRTQCELIKMELLGRLPFLSTVHLKLEMSN